MTALTRSAKFFCVSPAPQDPAADAGPHRQAPEPEPTQHRANAALGQGYIEPGFDHAGQIHPAPANHAIYGKVWSFANQLCYRRLLLWSEPWFRSSCYAVAEPGDSFAVVA